MQAFILAAGTGTRLRPMTDRLPKALIEVNGVPMLEWVIRHLIRAGFKDIIINIHHHGEKIIDFLSTHDNFGVSIRISDERDALLDTGGALKKARSLIDDTRPLLIHNTDVISTLDLEAFYAYHLNRNVPVTLAVQRRHSSNYLLFDRERRLCGWKSLKTGAEKITRSTKGPLSMLAFSGIHMVGPGFLDLATLTGCFPSDKSVFSIIHTYLCLAGVHPVLAFDHSETFWMDMGKPESICKTEELIKAGKLKL